MLYAIGEKAPRFADETSSWIAPTAVVIGDVSLARHTSIWWGTVLRGDNDSITLGEGSNIQENSVVHVDPGIPCSIGDNVTIGHSVTLHGCTIGDGTLVGIGAIILNGAKIGRNCLIGANSFVGEGKEIPDNSLVFGAPAKVVRELSEQHIERLRLSSESYVTKIPDYKSQLRRID
ncbi:gamma carbonic anhydrase family protein [Pelagibius sp. Alg239-R121]|uniref:gamma carbonic anhydrase family protein n=1 Tax=Pelagibius sp. Alg239-R121 TaxID=2993448 RepID=UPI0024A742CE|nr:gamma carbonic anhydrase family protein [Pelagibius sp. Alg239-R121]